MSKIIDNQAIQIRKKWIDKLSSQNDNFTNSFTNIEKDLAVEIKKLGVTTLINHLRLCGNIPEPYGHDTTVEKLYSKYTDAVICFAYREIGLNSTVLFERADSADVEAVAKDYSFVADAKAFRLSRTAKNQKDFKVVAMDKWKYGKQFAMIVCPIYQLPNKKSQIYEQAITKEVCILYLFTSRFVS